MKKNLKKKHSYRTELSSIINQASNSYSIVVKTISPKGKECRFFLVCPLSVIVSIHLFGMIILHIGASSALDVWVLRLTGLVTAEVSCLSIQQRGNGCFMVMFVLRLFCLG